MARTLLMACQDDVYVFLLMEHVENLQDDATGKREDRLDPFPLEALD